VKLFVPVEVGIPLISPVLAFRLSPAVSVPLMMLQLSGSLPPVAANVWLYAVLIVPFAKDVVVTTRGSYTPMLNAWLAVAPFASWTCTVKLLVPATVGVPLIAPVDVFKVNPVGSVPTVTLHTSGVFPPEAFNVWLYNNPVVPSANVAVVTDKAG
jgi:hypothetical protein